MTSRLEISNRKQIRAKLIKRHVDEAGFPGVVCFSCGNASRALINVGLYTVEISPLGNLQTGHWWTPSEIHRAWPQFFDATSGHLCPAMMLQLAAALSQCLGNLPERTYEVPTGSGETIVALYMAYPSIKFIPTYSDGPTKFEPLAPLNKLVARLVGAK